MKGHKEEEATNIHIYIYRMNAMLYKGIKPPILASRRTKVERPTPSGVCIFSKCTFCMVLYVFALGNHLFIMKTL
jgi:hypothetical protein